MRAPFTFYSNTKTATLNNLKLKQKGIMPWSKDWGVEDPEGEEIIKRSLKQS